MFFRDRGSDMASDCGDNRLWGQRAGVVSERVLIGTTGDYPNYRLCFTLRGKAAIVIDDILVQRVPRRQGRFQ